MHNNIGNMFPQLSPPFCFLLIRLRTAHRFLLAVQSSFQLFYIQFYILFGWFTTDYSQVFEFLIADLQSFSWFEVVSGKPEEKNKKKTLYHNKKGYLQEHFFTCYFS